MAKTYESDWLYHSHVVRADAFIAKIISDAKPSIKGNDPYFRIQLRDDGNEYNLTAENGKCVAVMAGAKKHAWLRFTATGNREGADLVLEETDFAVTGEPSYTGAVPETQGEAVVSGPGYPLESVNPYDSLFDAYQDCLIAANDLREWYVEVIGRDMDHVDQDLATSLYIQLNRDGFAKPLQIRDPTGAPSAEDLVEIESLLERKELSPDDRERAHASIADGISHAEASEWIARLSGRPDRQSDPLPF